MSLPSSAVSSITVSSPQTTPSREVFAGAQRREWDSNPRCLHTTVFKTVPIGRSGIPPVTRLLAGFDPFEAHVGAQHVGDGEAAVGLLVVLEQEHERAADRAGSADESTRNVNLSAMP